MLPTFRGVVLVQVLVQVVGYVQVAKHPASQAPLLFARALLVLLDVSRVLLAAASVGVVLPQLLDLLIYPF